MAVAFKLLVLRFLCFRLIIGWLRRRVARSKQIAQLAKPLQRRRVRGPVDSARRTLLLPALSRRVLPVRGQGGLTAARLPDCGSLDGHRAARMQECSSFDALLVPKLHTAVELGNARSCYTR